MKPITVVVDLDDFCDEYAPLDLLEGIKRRIPQFRLTLFTIPARTSRALMETVLGMDWIDLVPHGWEHGTNYECVRWTRAQIKDCLKRCEDKGFRTKGFKTPGWQISNDCYLGLRERGYWVADQPYNNHRRPAALPVYLIDAPNKIHGHVHKRLPALEQRVLRFKESEFVFIKDTFCNTI